MPLPTTAYPQNPLAGALENSGGLIQLVMALKKHHADEAFKHQLLGSTLGYPMAPATLPTEGPPTAAGVGPTPVPNPLAGTFPTAPAQMQPLMSTPIGHLQKLREALGDPQMTNIMATMGMGRGMADYGALQWDPSTSQFTLKPGATPTAKTAGIILKQRDISNKEDLTKWRDAAMKRLDRAQLTSEERISLSADADMLNFMVSPQFDLMDDTLKSQFQSQATSAVNRLQQRGVKVYTGARAKAMATATPAPGGTPPPPPKTSPQARFAAIKAANPGLSDREVYAQMAIEEASGQ